MSAHPRIVCISQARMTSSRLPGKVLMEAAGAPLLAHHLGRLRRARLIDTVVLATTINATDDPVAELAERLGIGVFRGDEQDVLGRFAGAAQAFGADVVVRVTADCPLIDPALIDEAVGRFLAGQTDTPPMDYVNIDTGRFPRGLDAEVFTRRALDEAAREAVAPDEREHVTPFLYRRPQRFRLGPPVQPRCPLPSYRWCVDEPDDLALIRRMLEALLPGRAAFGWQDCCTLLEANPAWSEINRGVAQRKLV
ncbi:glycosyltransferase family protein [Azospirillum sp. RWY-5-1]|uniref:Glycosyltransferase family protein n=1 Tax=Azospirillum oleiclasticum TaxID=2735135 RepID=A0ABX2TE49_9PROT|nr:glycosyltransferase family protein [Azospirillum oleiclasticum]NYZ15433.1 glycosyltransferase family protein [Azospirillum oleiclasticum]NYZ22456.1 glycosyltransferase family protein [Azospirillum oleiclasticum]